jgi:hypothetical protein
LTKQILPAGEVIRTGSGNKGIFSKDERKEMTMPADAHTLIQNHLQAATKGVDAVMQDFTDDSVLITPDATYRGLAEIRQFYAAFLKGLPKGFFDAFKMNRQEVVGDVAYILWEAKPWLLLATDTFVVRDGKVLFQTFAAYTGSK